MKKTLKKHFRAEAQRTQRKDGNSETMSQFFGVRLLSPCFAHFAALREITVETGLI
jgi:hypothetical protein